MLNFSCFKTSWLLFLGTIFYLNILPLQASEYGRDFALGLEAYEKKDFVQAIEHYEKALQGNMKSAEVYNNLGLAYAQNGDIGYAILNFERAIRLNPSLDAAGQNLMASQQRMTIPVKKAKKFWLFQLWDTVAYSLSGNNWAMLFIFSLFLASGGFIMSYMYKGKSLSTRGLQIGIIFIIFSLFPLIFGRQVARTMNGKNTVIIITPKAGIRSSPSINGEDITQVSGGTKATIKERKEEWARIRLENGVLGWIPLKMTAAI